MIRTRRLAVCAMLSALSVVLMALGAVMELGTYAAPMLAAMSLIPVGQKYGRKWQILVWLTAGALSLLLIPGPEQNLLFLGLFGWYPIVRPAFQKLHRLIRLPVKLVVLNAAMVSIEALCMLLLVPEAMELPFLILFLVLMNILLLCFDVLLPVMEILLRRVTARLPD